MNNALGFEQALIGTVLAHPYTVDGVMDVRPQDMSTSSHQNIWTEIIGMQRSGSLTTRGLIEVMNARDNLMSLGYDIGEGLVTGEAYIEAMLEHRAEPSIRLFADEVIDASTKRDLRSFGQLLALDAETEDEAAKIIEQAEERLFELRRRKMETGIDIGEVLATYDTYMDKWRNGDVSPAFKFTLPDVRTLIHFLEEQDFMIIAGRPGEAKSSLMRYEAFAAAKAGQKVVIFNLENGEVEYARYVIAFMTKINTTKLRQPELLSADEVVVVKAAIKELRNMPLRIVTLGAPSVREVVAIAAKLAREGYTAFFLDYLQLVRNGLNDEVQDISLTSSLLRGFALKYKCPMIAASQLNRNIVHRGADAEPDLSDLRASGSIEQDAVQVLFTRVVDTDDTGLRMFPENLDSQGNLLSAIRCVPIRMYVKKNRNGPIGRTGLIKWDKAINMFYPLQMP